jgi:ribosome-binding factor A
MAQGNRMQRLTGLVQSTLAEILQTEAEDSRFNMVTITSIGLARDLSSARVFVSVWDEAKAKETIVALNHASKYFRFKLAHAMKLRVVPHLKFVYDDSVARGHHISFLINAALKNTK